MGLHVLIAGGGIGGLCLAHGLRKAGIDVTVFERDPAPDFRRQGYRIHIDEHGDRALSDCLPADLYELYLATSAKLPDIGHATSFNHRLEVVRTMDPDPDDLDPARAPTAVNRLTLRQILLARLGDVVRFGHMVSEVEHDADGVRVRFADGSTASGTVLVGADGINSVVRGHLLPGVDVIDTGLRAITGKVPLDAGVLERIPPVLFNKFTGVLGPDHHALAIAIYRSRRPQAEAAAELAPDVTLDPVQDYLMWVKLAPRPRYPVGDAELWETEPATLHRFALDMVHDWHPDVPWLLEHSDPESCFPLMIRSSLPVDPWPSTSVTLLGDAIHAMTPVGGRGANTALADAALLADRLAAVDRGETDLLAAVGEYEARMRDFGFAAVEHALQGAMRVGATVPGREPQPRPEPTGSRH